MKIINEKGKLFGIINIIDLSILLILALIIVGGYSRLKSQPISSSEESEAIIKMEVSNIRMVTVESIVPGDPIYHYDKGTYIGEILEVSHKPYTEPLEYNGEWIDAELPDKYVASFTVKAAARDNADVVIVGGEQFRVGAQFRLKNKKATFFATVLGVAVN